MNLLRALLQALAFCGAGVVYILPLRKRPNWPVWIPVAMVLLLLCQGHPDSVSWLLLSCPLLYGSLLLMVTRSTRMSLAGACYCTIWSILTGEILLEIWKGVWLLLLPETCPTATTALVCLVIEAVFCASIGATLARWMPQKDVYQIGPRQLGSAFLLGLLFMAAACLLEQQENTIGSALLIFFCQFYCVSLLYVQTELFKKSRMQKDLNALNFLYDREQQQYATAKRNVAIVNRKCTQLEHQINAMQQYLPEEMRDTRSEIVNEALRYCDVMVRSGNDALDIVLTEKKLLADHHGVEIDCVADGSLLNFMEPVDIYALFSCALDNAIESVKKYPENSTMLIDILVHSAQNFVVIRIASNLQNTSENTVHKRWSGLRGYGLEMVRMTVEKYRGMLSVESDRQSVTLKILIPPAAS